MDLPPSALLEDIEIYLTIKCMQTKLHLHDICCLKKYKWSIAENFHFYNHTQIEANEKIHFLDLEIKRINNGVGVNSYKNLSHNDKFRFQQK